jgi:hypothetical protein
LDYTFHEQGARQNASSRITLEGIFNSRHDGLQRAVDPITILTLDQVYRMSGNDGKVYAGAGVGIYSGPFGSQTGQGILGATFENKTQFGGKLFVGTDLTGMIGAEAAVHFTKGITLAVLQLRLKL